MHDKTHTPVKIYNRLKRTEKCRRTIKIIKQIENYDYPDSYSTDILAILQNSAPFPLIKDIVSLSAYFPGGARYLARYPDIVINKFDVVRAKQFLKKHNISQSVSNYDDKIADSVYDILNVKDLVFRDYNYLGIYPWVSECKIMETPPFMSYGYRFIERVFNCNTTIKCNERKRAYPNTLTNISALPLAIGDCREIAWLTALLCNSGNLNKSIKYRVCYTTLYMADDEQMSLHKIFDHVFVLKIFNNTITIVDPFAMKKQDNGIILHNAKVRIVNKSNLKNYTFEHDLHSPLILECGQIYIDGIIKHRLLAIPKIYDGHINFIDTAIFNPYPKNKVLLWNKPIAYTDKRIWKTHMDWFI